MVSILCVSEFITWFPSITVRFSAFKIRWPRPNSCKVVDFIGEPNRIFLYIGTNKNIHQVGKASLSLVYKTQAVIG